MHIGHDSNVGICIASARVPFAKICFCPFLARWRVGRNSFLVLVFAATRSEMTLQSVLLINSNRKTKFQNYR